jgi:cytochrome b561
MPLVSTEQGYGSITKLLHWLTVLLLLAQFVLGYGMESFAESLFEEDSSGHGHGGDRTRAGDDQLVFVHAWLGGAILGLALIRLLWRWATPLPEWSERLTPANRVIEAWTEKVLYVTLFVIPLSGIGLLFFSGEERELENRREWQPPFDAVPDDLMLGAHIAGHLVFYAALLVHVALAVRRRTLTRML